MPIKFHCPSCHAAVKAPETYAGQTLPCPKCGQPVEVPDASEPTPADLPVPPAFPASDDREEEAIDELPDIVIEQRGAPETTVPPLASDSGENPFSAPQAKRHRVMAHDLQPIKIVDLDLPFKTVFKLAFQFFVSMMLLTIAMYAIFFILALLFGAIFGLAFFAF